jgi:hypothetical protein
LKAPVDAGAFTVIGYLYRNRPTDLGVTMANAIVTREAIVKRMNEFLNDNYYGPALLDVKMMGVKDGMTEAEVTYHRGKPEHVTTAVYRFRHEEWDNRVVIYF